MRSPIALPLPASPLTINIRLFDTTLLLLFIFILVFILTLMGSSPTTVLTGRDPRVAIALHGLVLVGEVDALALAVLGGVGLAALGEGAGAGGELGGDGRVGGDPVGERVFAVLDDAVCC